MGVRPFVNYLYSDLSDGLIIFQLYDIIRAGTVNWARVNQKFAKIRAFMQKIGTCPFGREQCALVVGQCACSCGGWAVGTRI